MSRTQNFAARKLLTHSLGSVHFSPPHAAHDINCVTLHCDAYYLPCVLTRLPNFNQLPRPATADSSASRRETFIVTHDQLRLNLLHRIHGDAHHNQERGSTKVERHA